MATIPNKIEKFADLEKDAFTTISVALWKKAAGLLDYINKSHPIGMCLFFCASQPGVPNPPNSAYWKFADGTAVNNVNSPLHGVTIPDCRGKFFKHPGTGQPVLVSSGQNSIDITHDHGGHTKYSADYGLILLDTGDEVNCAVGPHNHIIEASTVSVVSTIPAYLELQVYVRIV